MSVTVAGPTPTAIAGLGAAVPAGRLTNAELERVLDTDEAWILERTGIRERRVVDDDETTASLAALAARRALDAASVAPGDVELLVIATATPEQPMPHTGAYVGERLGLSCGSFDVAAACAGFVYALVAAGAMLAAGRLRNVLVIGSETLSRIVDPGDRGTRILFGDGAGAALLQPSGTSGAGLLAWDLGCDGSGVDLLGVAAGGSRRPTTTATVAAGEHFLHMDGSAVFKRAVRALVASAQATLARAEIDASEIAWFVPHQANVRIVEAAADRLGIPRDRTVMNIDRYGNTSAASIPIALQEADARDDLRPGDLVLCSGVGAGMTWGSALIRWGAP